MNHNNLTKDSHILESSLNRRDFLKTSAKFAGAFALSSAFIADSLFGAPNSSNAIAKIPKVKLNNGILMPLLGLGVLKITDLKECQRCVEDAISVGYRSIDTAQSYMNEEAVGAAVRNSLGGGLKREELFITTKLWVSDVNEAKAQRAFEISLKKLGLEYVDLYLLHQPYNDVYGAWRAMSKLYKEGLIKAIGVSNFYPDRIADFCLNNEVQPALNQIECNPLHAQFDAQKVLQEYNVAMESWAPFGEGRNNMFSNATLAEIGKKHNKSVAQVILRWLIQRGIVVIPKTTRKERMIENLNVFDFSLNETQMQQIAGLDSKESLFFNHRDPKMVRWINEVNLEDRKK